MNSQAGGSEHSRKFRLAIAILVIAGVASIAAAVAFTTGGRTRTTIGGTSWSAWQPSSGGLAGAQEIADYIGPRYRATAAYQLAVVSAMNLNNPASPIELAVPTQTSTATSSGLAVLSAGSTVAYNLCGVGSRDCSIGVGTPSSARLLLLRREALELALYTFEYISAAQTFVAILPPGHSVQACTGICAKPHVKATTRTLSMAVAFSRNELSNLLEHPLRVVLPGDTPPSVDTVTSSPNIDLVSVFTAHGLFQDQIEHAQDGSTLIVLNPLPAQ